MLRSQASFYTQTTDPELQDEILDLAQLLTPNLDRVPPLADLVAMLDSILAAQDAQVGGAPCAR